MVMIHTNIPVWMTMTIMSSRTRDNAAGLAKELRKTGDGIKGTLIYVEGKVSADVLEKVKTIIRQSIRYGEIRQMIEADQFKDGLEKELCD